MSTTRSSEETTIVSIDLEKNQHKIHFNVCHKASSIQEIRQASIMTGVLTTDIISELILGGFYIANPANNPFTNAGELGLYLSLNILGAGLSSCFIGCSSWCIDTDRTYSVGDGWNLNVSNYSWCISYLSGVGNFAINTGIMYAAQSILPAWSVPLITGPVVAATTYGLPALIKYCNSQNRFSFWNRQENRGGNAEIAEPTQNSSPSPV